MSGIISNPQFFGFYRLGFRWKQGELTDLGDLAFCSGFSGPRVVLNDRGMAVSTTGLFATLWDRGAQNDLGHFGGGCTSASDINNRREIVGSSIVGGSRLFGIFLWEKGAMAELGSVFQGGANAINERGQVVGSARATGTSPSQAFIWENGVMTELPSVGDETVARAISEAGDVIGNSFSRGRTSALLWTRQPG